MHDWVRNLAMCRFPKGPRSQGAQDAILAEIFRHVPAENCPPFCVEFGFDADTLTGGTGSNAASLVLDRGWKALLLDANHENPSINLHREFLTPANAADVFARRGVPPRPDYVSIDVDSTDLWLFRALASKYRASVYSVEYNPHFPVGMSVTMADSGSGPWQGDRAYGASLSALATAAREHGYSLVAVAPGLDAFFVRDDLIDDGSGVIAPPIDHWRFATLLQVHPPVRDERRVGGFVDYERWRSSPPGGDGAGCEASWACRAVLRAGARRFRLMRIHDRIKARLRALLPAAPWSGPEASSRPPRGW
jgi:hypothetical protein